MGSWNLTCAITRTPIHSDDEVRVIFLGLNPRTSRRGRGHLHVTGGWAPLSLPIEMRYTDYGTFEMKDPNDWRYLTLQVGIDTAIAGDDKAPVSLEKMFKLIEHGGLAIKTSRVPGGPIAPKVPVGVMAIHESAYRLMSQSFYDLGENTTSEALSGKLAEYLAPIKDIDNARMLRHNLADADDHSGHFWFCGCSCSSSPRVFGLPGPTPVDVLDEIWYRMQDGHDTTYQPIADRIQATAEMMVLQENMEAMAIPYGPTMNASDDFCSEMFDKIAALGKELITRDW